tara:strand:+ start:16 stop:270 length:255 start_codon:yes stop_codon:yes gene_type:complete
MPRYEYTCEECDTTMLVFHLIDESQDACAECGSLRIKKNFNSPISFSSNSVKERDKRVGELTEEFIQESREALKEEISQIEKRR